MTQESLSMSEGKIQPSSDHGNRRKIVTIVSVVLLLAVAIGGGGTWWIQKNHSEALAVCVTEQDDARVASQTLQKSRAKADKMNKVDKHDVAEPATVMRLHEVSKKQRAMPQLSCEPKTSTAQLRSHADEYKQVKMSMRQQAQQIDEASDMVARSQLAKALTDAKHLLHNRTDAGSTLLADSENKVADNACREHLQAVIGEATKLASDNPDDYVKAREKVQAAIDAVEASIRDKIANEQALRFAPAPVYVPTNQQTHSYRGQQSAPKSYQPAVPQSQIPPAPAPAPAAPAPQNNNNFDWNQWMENHKSGPVCVKGQACGIG